MPTKHRKAIPRMPLSVFGVLLFGCLVDPPRGGEHHERELGLPAAGLRSHMRSDQLDDAPHPCISSISRPSPDMGFDDAHFGGGSRATRVGLHSISRQAVTSTVARQYNRGSATGRGIVLMTLARYLWLYNSPLEARRQRQRCFLHLVPLSCR